VRLALVITVLAMGLSVIAAPVVQAAAVRVSAVQATGSRTSAVRASAVQPAATNPTPAQVAKAISGARRSKALWATVNICNSRRYPNTLGVRGQMPALGFPAWLSMRIALNYYSRQKKKFVPDPGSTKIIRLGRSRSGLLQGGAVYAFRPHPGLLNATVQFFWRRSGRLLGSTTLLTTGGHSGADFGSPPHFTAAQCRIA
jgi:hypothetical protein